ncbi:MAG: 2-succinyl-5-enolpyruvyl-6-hydroxy-3-cyclohexene-1-carboxylic-acid synthase [SAR324 cluster bacterium]|nr:2-succinyl-5-enolpyruvyl-6-hydroxy-3-cyclohexene-1-carboxylic-acid synthase [SAR324 cluster bacterium]
MSGWAASWNTWWGKWIIEELVRCNLKTFCISPGSRSTPLTASAARHPKAQTKLFTDERAAAYFALGCARATKSPVGLICTSGTAAANFLPAVAEASVEHIPLIVLTADRPPELQQTGANQSIDQNQLFGSHVRWFFDPGTPNPEYPLSALLSSIDYAVGCSRHPLPGPVHLNFPFREPLLAESTEMTREPVLETGLQNWREGSGPWIRQMPLLPEPDEALLEEILRQLPQQGIFSIGRVPQAAQGSITKLAEKLNWPVFADIGSGFRLGAGMPCRVTFYDQILLDPDFLENHPPQALLHLGFAPASKRWLKAWESFLPEKMIWVQESFARLDPIHRFRNKFEVEIGRFCERVTEMLPHRSTPEWTRIWLDRSRQVEELMESFLAENPNLTEMAVAHMLPQMIPESHALFLGNSLPVREVDFFGSGKGSQVPIGLNRGASGIDGLLASGAGFAHGLSRPVTLLIGDLSLIHDLNSLQLASENSEPIIIIVLNNHGGGIFSFLPVAEHEDFFESHFNTPHSLDFEQAAKMFGLDYFHPETMNDFENCYLKAVKRSGSSLIEIETNSQDNPKLQQIWKNYLLNHR